MDSGGRRLVLAVEAESPRARPRSGRSSPRNSPVRFRNWCNAAAFILNLAISYPSLAGAYGLTNAEVSAKYQTLVTPARWTFAIWTVIFASEGVTMVAQLLPRYRDCEVVSASSFWWQLTCFFQLLWTVAFSREALAWSAACMLAILASLIMMACRVDAMSLSLDGYLLLRMPFALHMSWVACVSAVSVNVLADASGVTPSTLLAVAIVSLVAIACFVAVFSLAMAHPEPLVPFVAALALGGMGRELTEGTRLNSSERFNPYVWPEEVVLGVRSAAVVLNGAAGLSFFVAVAMLLRKLLAAKLPKA